MKLTLTLFWGALKDQPVKWLVTLLSIAVGVGLGYAVHLIHHQALQQFEAGIRTLSGQADLQLLPFSKTVPEAALDRLDDNPDVRVASPVVQATVKINGLKDPIEWIGLDVFRAALVTPNLIGHPNDNTSQTAFLGSRSVMLSPALANKLGKVAPITLQTSHNGKNEVWRVEGSVPAAGTGQTLAVSDIAAVQWQFGQIGLLSRIDIKLRDGISVDQFRAKYGPEFSGFGHFETVSEQTAQGASISQAYRANLSILAMVALLTGGFLSFSTQMLSVAQRARQWALLGAIGMKQSTLRRQILAEAACIGVLGSLGGVALGFSLASAVVSHLGADLGAGYFAADRSSLEFNGAAALLYAAFGLLTAMLGALLPASQARALSLNQRLRTGSEESGLQFANRAHVPAIALLILALPCLLIPAVGNIPVGGYLAVALGLFGGILLIGPAVRWIMRPRQQVRSMWQMSVNRLASTPNLLAVGLAGVVASFALVVSMHVMIYSFRQSLDNWLNQVLPAPLYLKTEHPEVEQIPPKLQAEIRNSSLLGKVEFLGQTHLSIDPARPAVELISRPLTAQLAENRLPLIGPHAQSDPSPGLVPAWVSEPVADIYGKQLNDEFTLKLDNGHALQVKVMGIWRDYARQHGAIVVSQQSLEKLGLDLPHTQAALWPKPGVSVADLRKQLETLASQHLDETPVSFSQPDEIRRISLAIFDKSFAVTYLLEVAALVIGLFGVATAFSAMGLQRKREFALLSAIGAQKTTMLGLLLREGLLASSLACGLGLLIGLAFAWILVFVVNPQSFHWSMEWYTPWRDLGVMCTGLIAVSCLTAALSIQHALGKQVIGQLKEDWS
ncbi:MAG TPA: FtsX-like permease family protein [Limnobacter sp.]|uniref:FtsX-like permease family protein n=1 Tax=Limnobacter sp. TaxID=2003368 RepID=UPI002E353CA5|nr:FtsX-like permease family protein [Limnobacter sp.]HEX5486112.1 FtsX-like permease family protein [Limnobacter sp.]